MDRVAVFKTFVVLLILVFWDAPNSRVEAASKPPNILMIFSDDVTKLDLGSYGNSAVRTPTLSTALQRKSKSTPPEGCGIGKCLWGVARPKPFPTRSGAIATSMGLAMIWSWSLWIRL